MFLTLKKPWPTFACQNLGTFKEDKDIGLTLYRNLRFSICQNLGVFHKNRVFDGKNPWPTFAIQNLGIFEECKDFGPTRKFLSNRTGASKRDIWKRAGNVIVPSLKY